MAIAGIAVLAGCICFLEVPYMWRRRQFKELWLFSAILALGAGLAIALGMHVPILNPLDWVGVVFRPIGRLVETALGAGGEK